MFFIDDLGYGDIGAFGCPDIPTPNIDSLAAEGAKVGVLDADIYGPSQPRMLGVSGQPESKDGKSLEPLENYGIQAMSIGFLIDEETPMIWRGPMVTQALEQLLNDTNWDSLDYLVIDLPPGTGDTQLTLAQKVPVSGAIIVTTPQDIALLDARKGFKMFEKVEVPVLGIVENMSIHICSNCGHEEHIFGEGGGQRMSDDYDVDFLGALPLDIRIREEVDSGKPSVIADPDNTEVNQAYLEWKPIDALPLRTGDDPVLDKHHFRPSRSIELDRQGDHLKEQHRRKQNRSHENHVL